MRLFVCRRGFCCCHLTLSLLSISSPNITSKSISNKLLYTVSDHSFLPLFLSFQICFPSIELDEEK